MSEKVLIGVNVLIGFVCLVLMGYIMGYIGYHIVHCGTSYFANLIAYILGGTI